MNTLLTKEVHALIVRMVRNGNYLETAAAAAGIQESTVQEWVRRGRISGEEPYASFSRDIMAAEASKEDELLGRIESAGRSAECWQANAWILARRHPKRWQEKVQIELANELERMLQHLEQRLSPAEYTRVLEALADTTTTRALRRPSEATSPGTRALPAFEPTSE